MKDFSLFEIEDLTGQIRNIAFEILEHLPEGIRYSELSRRILQHNPAFNKNTTPKYFFAENSRASRVDPPEKLVQSNL